MGNGSKFGICFAVAIGSFIVLSRAYDAFVAPVIPDPDKITERYIPDRQGMASHPQFASSLSNEHVILATPAQQDMSDLAAHDALDKLWAARHAAEQKAALQDFGGYAKPTPVELAVCDSLLDAERAKDLVTVGHKDRVADIVTCKLLPAGTPFEVVERGYQFTRIKLRFNGEYYLRWVPGSL